jgi:hypothetical protein
MKFLMIKLRHGSNIREAPHLVTNSLGGRFYPFQVVRHCKQFMFNIVTYTTVKHNKLSLTF